MVLLCVDLLQVPHYILKAVVVPLLHVLLGSTMSNILPVLSKAMLGNEKPLNVIHLVYLLNKILYIGGVRVRGSGAFSCYFSGQSPPFRAS